MLEIGAPDIIISEDCLISDEGWFKLDHPETLQECMERAKETIRKLKIKASIENNMKKTVFAVSHSDFMAALYCLIT